ncbi:DNA breaking-rejoining protein [Salmonella enterica subsp. enterica serovar Newport]|uniref:DNA breaking-rejoining protein n=1 Tax=Salmonella newport TaxID=108619 RepID=A0A5U9KWP4_SALNE|nr:DNA breaking-rejoining protein [Salmonella enterica subsp. enterica serovar Newport]ECN8542015.1 DNA breaking-rejoining protein [Salmonella enterica subsp. enterica serovar Newport]EJH8886100.1 PD-(D/E)XK nuclease-like domain-containing protein [Salmonella enterica]
MSNDKEDFALHCPVKNEEARKRLGIKAGFFWTTAKKLSVAVSRCIAVMDDKGYDEDDFKKPVRVNLPAVGDLPPEGVFDTEFCNRYEKGGEDGKTMMLIPGAATADQFHGEAVENTTVINDTPVTDTEADSDDSSSDPLPAYAYNVNGELMSDVEEKMLQPVASMGERHRILSQFILEGEFSHRITPEQLSEVNRMELDMDDTYIQNMLLACHNVPEIHKLDNPNLWKFTDAFKKIFPQGKRHTLHMMMNFVQAYSEAHPIDRILLTKEWAKGNRVSCINRTPSGNNAGGGIQSDRKMPQTILGLEFEIALGLLARKYEFDIYSLPLEIELKANSIMNSVDDPEWLATRELFVSMPGGLDYSRACVIATVKTTPENLYESPFRQREYLNKVLTETDHANPDPLVVDIACGRSSMPMPMKGSTSDDEEKPQPTGELADEPATPEAVEQDTTEHHPDPQPLENEPPVSQTEAGYQKIRAELHEARKNIPPKNPVDVGKQLAAARGEYVEGISDPDDPKWVKTETSPRTNKPEIVTKVANGIFDVTALLKGSSIHGEKQEVETTVSEPEMPETKPEPQYTWPEYFEPGRYEGVPNDIYHAANGISSTMVKDARVSLMYYEGRHVSKTIKKERSKVLDMGNLVHVLALQPEILDAEFSIEPEIPEGALTTTATIRAVIDEYNASLTPQLSADEIKTLLEEYNSSLPAPVPLGGDKDAIGVAYLELPDDFKRIVGDDKNFTASTMKACIKEYNATLPPQVRTSGNRDALLEQLAIINPDLVAQEAQKPQPLKVSGAKADLIQAVKSVKPDAVFADELLDAWRENPGNKILVTRQQYETALAIQSALYAHPEAGKLLQNPTRAVEVSYFGIDDDTGLDIRVRPDVELEYEGLRIGFDLKTISMWDVKEDSLKSRLHREITMRDYHLSAGMYCNVADLDKFAWIFVNKDEGYHWVAVVWASDSLLELGKLEYRRTIRAIANAMDTGEWPAPVTADYTDELNDYDLRRLEALREMA